MLSIGIVWSFRLVVDDLAVCCGTDLGSALSSCDAFDQPGKHPQEECNLGRLPNSMTDTGLAVLQARLAALRNEVVDQGTDK